MITAQKHEKLTLGECLQIAQARANKTGFDYHDVIEDVAERAFELQNGVDVVEYCKFYLTPEKPSIFTDSNCYL